MKNCIICKEQLSQGDLDKIAEEFISYPVCEDCFDMFDTADDFLEEAKKISDLQSIK